MKSPSEILAILDRRIELWADFLDRGEAERHVINEAAGALEEDLWLRTAFGFGEYPWPDETSESLRDEDVRLDNGQRYKDAKP